MPIEHKKYGCKFKCGYRHKSSWPIVVNHESQCWYNPEVKSCITCNHGNLVHYSDGYGRKWSYRTCAINDDADFEGIRPVVGCIKHEIL
jgi:hypothetical protein